MRPCQASRAVRAAAPAAAPPAAVACVALQRCCRQPRFPRCWPAAGCSKCTSWRHEAGVEMQCGGTGDGLRRASPAAVGGEARVACGMRHAPSRVIFPRLHPNGKHCVCSWHRAASLQHNSERNARCAAAAATTGMPRRWRRLAQLDLRLNAALDRRAAISLGSNPWPCGHRAGSREANSSVRRVSLRVEPVAASRRPSGALAARRRSAVAAAGPPWVRRLPPCHHPPTRLLLAPCSLPAQAVALGDRQPWASTPRAGSWVWAPSARCCRPRTRR